MEEEGGKAVALRAGSLVGAVVRSRLIFLSSVADSFGSVALDGRAEEGGQAI